MLKFRAPDVVEFAVSPQVGQAVLAFARSYSKFSAGGQVAPPAPPVSSRHRKEWLNPFSPPGRNCGATSGVLTFVVDMEGKIASIEEGNTAIDVSGPDTACSRLAHKKQ